MKKAGRQEGDNLLSKTVLGHLKLMNRAVKTIKSATRSRNKIGIQHQDSHSHESLKEILESLYRYFTKNNGRMKDFIDNVERKVLHEAEEASQI